MSGRIFSRAWAKPLLKWAGGKTQLLEELTRRFPPELEDGHLRRYVEPFIGGGAVFFHVVQRFRFEECHIWDINEELVLAYRVVKQAPDQLISALRQIQDHYLRLPDEERERFYYNHRRIFNDTRSSMDFSRYSSAWVSRASQLFFLNRTCYNGLYRVNRNGDFNVPYGRYRNPRILDEENIRRASGILAGAHIHQGDFGDCLRYAGSDTFVYLDPPYRPVSRTSSFTAYVQHGFTDQDQVRLAGIFSRLDAKGAKVMLSNSDPANEAGGDPFLEDLYQPYRIERVGAKRMINSVGVRRGRVQEMIVTNYPA